MSAIFGVVSTIRRSSLPLNSNPHKMSVPREADQPGAIKEVFELIEKNHGRTKASLVSICKKDTTRFGEAASPRRKWFQKTVNNRKNKYNPDQYVKFLRSIGVEPCELTLQLQREHLEYIELLQHSLRKARKSEDSKQKQPR